MKCHFPDFWKNSSIFTKIIIMLVLELDLMFTVVTIRDIWKRYDNSLNGSRLKWTMLAFIDVIGPIIYWTRGRKAIAE